MNILSARPKRRRGLKPPIGFVFLVDKSGNHLIDSNGNYIIVREAIS